MAFNQFAQTGKPRDIPSDAPSISEPVPLHQPPSSEDWVVFTPQTDDVSTEPISVSSLSDLDVSVEPIRLNARHGTSAPTVAERIDAWQEEQSAEMISEYLRRQKRRSNRHRGSVISGNSDISAGTGNPISSWGVDEQDEEFISEEMSTKSIEMVQTETAPHSVPRFRDVRNCATERPRFYGSDLLKEYSKWEIGLVKHVARDLQPQTVTKSTNTNNRNSARNYRGAQFGPSTASEPFLLRFFASPLFQSLTSGLRHIQQPPPPRLTAAHLFLSTCSQTSSLFDEEVLRLPGDELWEDRSVLSHVPSWNEVI